MSMRALILGIGDAFTATSFGASALIRTGDRYVLIDCPDLIHRAIREASDKSGWDVPLAKIRDVVITHLHGDHCNGLESFGFSWLVMRLKGQTDIKPTIHTHRKAADRLWARLAPAMDAPLTAGGRRSRLEDFFNLNIIEPGTPATIAGLRVECRHTIHPVPTIGLKLRDESWQLGWSGDTVFDQDHIDWLADSDIIVHEANIGPAHTHIELLNQLPDELREKMRVTHVVDDYDPSSSDIPPLETGEVLEVCARQSTS
ncbi:MAG: MBL fold metallo-hydrolase [Phycisphaerales bacterium]